MNASSSAADMPARGAAALKRGGRAPRGARRGPGRVSGAARRSKMVAWRCKTAVLSPPLGGRFVTVSKPGLETVTKRGELGGIKRHCSIIRYGSSLYEFRYKSSLRRPVLYRKASLPPTCKKLVVITYCAR